MKKQIRSVLIEMPEFSYHCDRCGRVIDNPTLLKRESYNTIRINGDTNYTRYGGENIEYELCTDCLEHCAKLLNKEMEYYNATITE